MKWVKSALRILAASFAVLVLCLSAFSQANNGRISGNLTDQSGGAIVGGSVLVTNVDTNVTRTLVTDDAGAYNAPNLAPGNYKVSGSFKGFKTVDRTSVILEVGKEIRVDISLEPGAQNETVTVTEAIPMVDVSNSTLGGTLQPGTIADLPLNGRNFMNLLALRPGVTIYPGGGAWTQSTNGMRPEHNFYVLDGISAFEPFSAQSTVNSVSLSGDAATVLPIDAIQEFNTIENPKAEYGWKPGAITSIALRSGTNALHGSANAFGRTDALDAFNPFLNAGRDSSGNALPKQQVAVEEFGADVGGPLIKDKMFYFVGYEGQRYSIGNPAQNTWPSILPGGGTGASAVDACLAVVAPQIRSITSLAMAGLDANCNRISGAPTIFQNQVTTSSYLVDFDSVFRVDTGLAKFDWHVTDKHTITARYFDGDNNGTAVNSSSIVQPQWRPAPYSKSYVLGANWTWTPSSSVVNELRFGYSRFTQAFAPGDCNSPLNPVVNQGTTVCGFTNISLAGFSGSTGCCGSFPKYQGPDQTPEFIEQISILRGKHSFKFGGEYRDNIFNGGTFNNSRGNTTFAGGAVSATNCASGVAVTLTTTPVLQNFFAGCVGTSTIFIGAPIRHVTQNAFAGFAQDDWRIRQRLTLNLGVRYEYLSPIKEAQNRLANFDPVLGLVQVGNSGDINLRSNPYLPDKNNFSPRVGFAWDVRGNGKTVVRGGGGIIYVLEGFNIFLSQQSSIDATTGMNTNPSGIQTCTGTSSATGFGPCSPGAGSIVSGGFNITPASGTNPFGINWNQSPAFNGGAIYPNAASGGSSLNCNPTKPCNLQAVSQNLVSPYVEEWSLGVQHAFTSNLSLDVTYVGNHGNKLIGIYDLNAPPPGAGYCIGFSPAQITAANALSAATPGSATCPAGAITTATKVSAGAEQSARPFFAKFPYYGYMYYLNNMYISNYDGLQVALTQRTMHGLSYTVGYTFSHALDDASNDWAGTGQLPQNMNCFSCEYSNSGFDIRHRLTVTFTYALPGKKGFGQALEGWKVTSIVSVQSGLPWGVINGSKSFDPSGTAEFQERWNFSGNPADFSDLGNGNVPFFAGTTNPACVAASGPVGSLTNVALQKWGCFVKGGSMMLPPAIGGFGNLTRNTFRGNGLQMWDASVIKDWKFTERFGGEFRFEVFNLLNHTQYGSPQFNGGGGNVPFSTPAQFGQSQQTPDVANNNPSIGAGAARTIQMGFKVSF